MRARSVLPVLLALAAVAAGADGPGLPSALSLPKGEHRKARVEIALGTGFASREHKVRSLEDAASIDARLDLAVGEPRDGFAPVEASFESLSVHRRMKARISGLLSDDARDQRGDASWKLGEAVPPPGFRFLVSPRGLALADTSPVTSAWARWVGEPWLDKHDGSSGEDSKIRRLARYTELGTLLSAPALPESREKTSFEAAFPLQLGESGLTNAFIDLRLVYSLEIEQPRDGLLRVHGPLARVELVKGRPCGDRKIDEWLDLAFSRGGPQAKGELEAIFDPKLGRFRECRSSVSLVHEGSFDGGSGRAFFERTVVAKED